MYKQEGGWGRNVVIAVDKTSLLVNINRRNEDFSNNLRDKVRRGNSDAGAIWTFS